MRRECGLVSSAAPGGRPQAFEIVEQYWEQLGKLLHYARYCAGRDMQAIVCRDFWLWTVYAAVGLGLLIAGVVGQKLLREQLEFYHNRKRLEARKIVADAETMQRAKWTGEDTVDVDLSQDELAAAIRQEMDARSAVTDRIRS